MWLQLENGNTKKPALLAPTAKHKIVFLRGSEKGTPFAVTPTHNTPAALSLITECSV